MIPNKLQTILLRHRIYFYLFLIKYLQTATVRMARNRTIDIPVNLYNYGGGTLTGLTFETTAGNGITANVINPSDPSFPLVGNLSAGQTLNLALRITSSSTAPDTSYATMKAKVNEGLSKTLNVSISIVQLIPIITTSPTFIDTGMVRGNQKIATFTVKNIGEEVLRNARIEGPSTLWMSLTVNRAIGDITPGTSKTIGIMFSPPTTLAQGVYDDRVVIYSDNHIPYTYHIQVTVTSNAVGNVLFDVLNELMEDVPNATITFQHQTLPELIYTVRTATDGSVMQYDIPEGRYTYNVSPPPGHTPYSGSFTIQAGMTTTVPIALEMTMVTVTWSVTPTVIQDKYEIVVTQTFETNVPAPVLIVEPPNINLPALQPGQVFNGEFKVTNYGLIEVYDVVLDFPRSIDDYDIEVMTSAMPNKIGAMKSITVPYRITRRITTASLIKSLFEEITGYGGGNCVKNFNITIKGKCVICPNTAAARIVEKIANYLISIFYDCPGTITPSTPPTYTLPGGTQIYINTTSTTGQGTGGNIGGTSTTPIQTSNPCNCKDEGAAIEECKECRNSQPTNKPDETLCKNDGNECTADKCVDGICTHPPDDSKSPWQISPNDCQREVCVNGEKRSIADDGETPVQAWWMYECQKKICENGFPTLIPDDSRTPKQTSDSDCRQEVCLNGNVISLINDSESPGLCKQCSSGGGIINKPDGTSVWHFGDLCCFNGEDVPNEPISSLDQCPNRVQKSSYTPQFNGCGPIPYGFIIPDNPMLSTHLNDPIYILSYRSAGSFTGPCDWHDICFANCTKEFDSCNEGIRQRARDVCAIDYANNEKYKVSCPSVRKGFSVDFCFKRSSNY